MTEVPSAHAICAELERVLATPYFLRSQGLSHFLRFIVEQTLAGRASELKEHTIGEVWNVAVRMAGRAKDPFGTS